MSHRQLELVRKSYERIRRVRPLFADLFNRRWMLIAPALERLLPAEPEHRDRAFIELVEQVVVGLDRLDELLPALAAQARAWQRYGVEPHDYDLTGEALIWTVEQVLAGSSSAVDAWRETFELLAGVMKRAASEPALPAPPSRRPHTPTPPYIWGVRPPPLSERTPRHVGGDAPIPRSHRLPPVSEHTPVTRDTLPSL